MTKGTTSGAVTIIGRDGD